MAKRNFIMIHHSLTKDSGTVSWAAIEKYHRETQGWSDIGYHAGIESVTDSTDLVPYRYQAMIGRPEELHASACPQGEMNRVALHVCFVGDYDKEVPPELMLIRAVNRIIRPWMLRYDIASTQIVGHRDFNPNKSCPGTMFDLERLRKMVR